MNVISAASEPVLFISLLYSTRSKSVRTNKLLARYDLIIAAGPVITFVLAAACFLYARKSPSENAFDNVKKQLSADMAMLREVSVP